MRRREARARIALGVAAAVVVGLVAAPVVYFIVTYGCRGADYDLAEQLARSQWLQLVPPDASPRGPSSQGCDDDDKVAKGTRTFETSSVTSAVEFYARRLEESGWRAADESTSCWIWSDGEREASFGVYERADGGGYDVELSSRTDGQGGWCK